ncbi:hypothetical protein B0G82_1015 [Paraburkholderia sp. BL17N1]|nr:hypothetical protein B0G82_1015 [Paraburkholderia sp. BL17N1]
MLRLIALVSNAFGIWVRSASYVTDTERCQRQIKVLQVYRYIYSRS